MVFSWFFHGVFLDFLDDALEETSLRLSGCAPAGLLQRSGSIALSGASLLRCGAVATKRLVEMWLGRLG